MTDAETQTPAKKRRPRFSLLNLLLMMTIAAMALGLWREHQKLTPLRQEVQSLRRELGFTPVDDPQQVYVTSLRGAFDPFRQMRWRAHVPEGASAEVRLRLKESGKGWSGSSSSSRFLEPGDSVFGLVVSRETTGDRWTYALCDHRGAVARKKGRLPPWYTDDGQQRAFSMNDCEGLAPGKSHDILREKTTRADGSTVEVVVTITRAP